ncbi:DUF6261 family protein [Parabacteroides sp. FAFU027]|uniref:DUF6261 family protein n=1 Tax=Parabacteroides sp. FAFU027 TaxID=2922715 RepID=UPI001FAF0374|nr:DUF6261 family protein [Parabacteroides sp. FAFU027]
MRNFSTSKLTIRKLSTLSINLIGAVRKSGIPEAQQGAVFEELVNQDALFTLAIARSRYSSQNQSLTAISAERSRIISGFKGIVYNLTKSPIQAERDAANLLYPVFTSFGRSLTKTIISEQTGVINTFLAKLREQKYTDALNAINLSSWKSKVEELQQSFVDQYVDRDSDQKDINVTKSATGMREDLTDAINNYYEWIHATSIVNKQEIWKNLAETLMQNYNNAVSSISTSSDNTSSTDSSSSATKSETDSTAK